MRVEKKVPKKGRRPGSKPARKRKKGERPGLPAFPPPRVPEPRSPLRDFMASIEDEGIPYTEAIEEFRENWCDHSKWDVLVTRTHIVETDKDEYDLRCAECGKHKTRKGRPSRAV